VIRNCPSCEIAGSLLIEWRRAALRAKEEKAEPDEALATYHKAEQRLDALMALADRLPEGEPKARVLRDIERATHIRDGAGLVWEKSGTASQEYGSAAEDYWAAAQTARTCKHVGYMLDGGSFTKGRWLQDVPQLRTFATEQERAADLAPVKAHACALWPAESASGDPLSDTAPNAPETASTSEAAR
jgi:hypothetical protein